MNLRKSMTGRGSGIGCTESFEIAFTGGLFFTGFEGKKEAVGMVLADIGETATKRLVPDCILLTVFTPGFFSHDYFC
jgi:hypothetical protein